MFGQFSQGSCRRTKADMLEVAGSAVTWSRKAGHNRLHFKTADGAEHYMLHATVIATLAPDKASLTLNDGGWASMTTRRAWGDAVAAFGLPRMYAGSGKPHAANSANGHPFDRTITLTVPGYDVVQGGPAAMMIRAVVAGADSLEVRYEGFKIISSSGIEVEAPVAVVALELYRILELAKANRNFVGSRYDAMNYKDSIEVFHGMFTVNAGRFGRSVHVGCHEFKVTDLRTILVRLTAEYPGRVKLGRKAFLRKQREAKAAAKQAA